MDGNSDIISPVFAYSDDKKNKNNKKMSSLLTIEDGQLLEGDVGRIYELYDKGVRLITLVVKQENCI